MFIFDVRIGGVPGNGMPGAGQTGNNGQERIFAIQYNGRDGRPAIMYVREGLCTNGRVLEAGYCAQLNPDPSVRTSEESEALAAAGLRTVNGQTYTVVGVYTREQINEMKRIRSQHLDTFVSSSN